MDIVEFVNAGSARFTLESRRTGKRYTYHVRNGFVRLLTGPNNESDYQGIGVLRGGKVYSKRKHPACAALQWALAHADNPDLAFHHEGRCGRCGRTLTTPDSIERGLGPECASK